MGALTFPFNVDDRGRIAFTRDPVRQAASEIINCVVTRKYERPMRPMYGGGVLDFLFHNMGAQDIADLVRQIRDGVEQYVPSVRVEHIDARPSDDVGSTLEVVVMFSMSDDMSRTVFRADVTIDGSVFEKVL